MLRLDRPVWVEGVMENGDIYQTWSSAAHLMDVAVQPPVETSQGTWIFELHKCSSFSVELNIVIQNVFGKRGKNIGRDWKEKRERSSL